MSRTDDLIKKPIGALVTRRSDVLRPPPDGPTREYPLAIGGTARRFLADWAFRLADGGRVFIEDDDDRRALHNLTKYWMWMDHHAIHDDVHLVHLIGPGARDLVLFEAEQAKRALPRFHYYLIEVKDWAVEDWLGALEQVIDSLAPGGDGAIRPAEPIEEEAFVGMWKDRPEMEDSTAWVRGLRRTQWSHDDAR
ncbi:MAG TPA: hypothetical protein VK610_03905 [Rhodothermales bacterium]|nr:hypothetical protein [Rhodothermales bacterium]